MTPELHTLARPMQHFIDRVQMGDDSTAVKALARDLAERLREFAH